MRTILGLMLVIAFASPAVADTKVDYLREIKPILKARCYACHGSLKQNGKLRVDTVDFLKKGGKHGSALGKGDTEEVRLLERLTATSDNDRMPPEGKPLTPEQIALVKAWIAAGAPGPVDELPEEDPRQHWAFVKPVRPLIPVTKSTSQNPIDRFLEVERERRKIPTATVAERHVLLRRVYLDLIGLPPTREELAVFLADTSPDAYEKVVDRLLASPQYGERWGRHWMDVWRYSDWYGRRSVPDNLNSYGQMWRWRDWIVQSLNEDRGYDQMIREMLAADELHGADDSKVVATGFVLRNFFRWNYNNWMRDNVEHTAKAFLGLTLNCCHCHDHKYDPITQEEYFKFRAIFEPIEVRHDRRPGELDPGPFEKYVYAKSYKPITTGAARIFDEKLDVPTHFYTGGDERNRVKDRPPVPPGVPASLGGSSYRVEAIQLPPEAWYLGLKTAIREEERIRVRQAITSAQNLIAQSKERLTLAESRRLAVIEKAPGSALPGVIFGVKSIRDAHGEVARRTLRRDELRLAAASAALESVERRIAADDVIYLGKTGDPKAAAESASLAERIHQREKAEYLLFDVELALAVLKTKKTPLAELKVGEAQIVAAKAKRDAAVKAAEGVSSNYPLFTPTFPKTTTGRRAALARWITDRDNPLTARVAINHIWARHFGRPLVETMNNFGRSGKRPTHPELLDWLAVELVERGWQMKPLHHLMVTSQAYRLSSQINDSTTDPDNLYVSRFPTLRMEAEVVRDAVLSASGSLDLSMGGPELPHEQGMIAQRRSIYFSHHGESKMQFLELFDGASACDAYRRTVSILPQQALAMGNSDLALREARRLARKLHSTIPEEGAFLRAAFEQLLGRPPTREETDASVKFLQRQTKLFEEKVAEVKTTGVGVDGPSPTPAIRARENFLHALFNHNDFVTIR